MKTTRPAELEMLKAPQIFPLKRRKELQNAQLGYEGRKKDEENEVEIGWRH